jgi:cyclic lactone autoinducer peptide
MKAILVSIVSALGALVAATATTGCLMFWIDEPKMPKAMLNK